MKTLKFYSAITIFILFILFTNDVSAQVDTITPVKRSHVNNIIKWNVAGLLMGSISLQDEVFFNSKISVALGANIGVSSLFLPKYIIDNNKVETNDMTWTGYTITPEVRFYLAQNAPKGIYLAPYFRTGKYKMEDLLVNYTSDGNDKVAIGTGTYKISVGGVMLGIQARPSKKFVTDWWILGLAYGKSEIEINAPGTYSQEDLDSFEENVGGTSSSFKTDGSTSSNLNIIYKVPLTFRMGFSIGYVF